MTAVWSAIRELRRGRDPRVLIPFTEEGFINKVTLSRLGWILIGCHDAAGALNLWGNQVRKKMGRQHHPSRSALPGAWEHFRRG